MEKLKLFLQSKKEKSNKQLPKYGMRKLSVGLVSCFLGCAIFMTPSVVNAESEMPAEDKAIVADTNNNETTETPALENLENTETENVAKAESNVEPLAYDKEIEIEETTPKAEDKDTLESEDDKEAIAEDNKAAQDENETKEATELVKKMKR